MISLYGPKGLTWDYDENGKTYFTELGLRAKQDRDTEMTDGYTGTYGDGGNQMNNSTWNIDSPNPDSNGESYNYLNWASYNASQKYSILEDYRKFFGFTTQQEYLDSKNYSVVIGTSYSESKRTDEMELKWQQVSNAIRDYSWRAIYSANDDEYDRMVEEMKVQAINYGYEDVCQFYREEAARRKALEDEIKK